MGFRDQTRSIGALRKLLLAFRSAASAGETTESGPRWELQSPAGTLCIFRYYLNRVLISLVSFSIQQAHCHNFKIYTCRFS